MVEILEGVPLSTYTTFRVGGRVRYMAFIKNVDDLAYVLARARERGVGWFVLGAGSNVLVSDEDIDALAISFLENPFDISVTYEPYELGSVLCVTAAGTSWDTVVADTVRRGYAGIENLSLIPGTVGAAAVQNIGAYGVEIKDVLEWVEVFDTKTGDVLRMSCATCGFGYRMSVFKRPEGRRYIVLRVALRLTDTARASYESNISYKDFGQYFSHGDNPTLQAVRDAVVSIRRAKLPDPALIPNAGSFFKNPVIDAQRGEELAERFPGLPLFSTENSTQKKTSAAWIIDHVCNLKGVEKFGVTTHATQPLVIINPRGASARDIDRFASYIEDVVQEKIGITLEREVEYISNDTIKNFFRA